MTLRGGAHYVDSTRPHVRGWLETGDESSHPPRFFARLHTADGVVKVVRYNLRPVLRGIVGRHGAEATETVGEE